MGRADEPLRIYFRPGIGRSVVYGAGAFALFLILYGFATGDGFLMLMSLMPMAFSAYHLPAHKNDKPQLTVNDSGVTLDGLGHLPWEVIEDFEYLDPYEDGSLRPELVIVTTESLELIIDPQDSLTLMRTFQIMSWQLEEMHIIRVRLSLLDIDPDALLQDLRRRLRNTRTYDGQW